MEGTHPPSGAMGGDHGTQRTGRVRVGGNADQSRCPDGWCLHDETGRHCIVVPRGITRGGRMRSRGGDYYQGQEVRMQAK